MKVVVAFFRRPALSRQLEAEDATVGLSAATKLTVCRINSKFSAEFFALKLELSKNASNKLKIIYFTM